RLFYSRGNLLCRASFLHACRTTPSIFGIARGIAARSPRAPATAPTRPCWRRSPRSSTTKRARSKRRRSRLRAPAKESRRPSRRRGAGSGVKQGRQFLFFLVGQLRPPD